MQRDSTFAHSQCPSQRRYGRGTDDLQFENALIDVRHIEISPASPQARQRKAAVEKVSTAVPKHAAWRNQTIGFLSEEQLQLQLQHTIVHHHR